MYQCPTPSPHQTGAKIGGVTGSGRLRKDTTWDQVLLMTFKKMSETPNGMDTQRLPEAEASSAFEHRAEKSQRSSEHQTSNRPQRGKSPLLPEHTSCHTKHLLIQQYCHSTISLFLPYLLCWHALPSCPNTTLNGKLRRMPFTCFDIFAHETGKQSQALLHARRRE